MTTHHETVLLEEAVDALALHKGGVYVDATVGGAGHFARMLRDLEGTGTLLGIDADDEALARARAVSTGFSGTKVVLVEDNFRNLSAILTSQEIPAIDGILFDLGWSAFHLSRGRGFSFKTDEPLLMTYGEPTSGATAADLINTLPEDELADILFTYGEERFSRAIARAIVAARKEGHILTTRALATLVEDATPAWYRARRIHPATKTFQALRIAVNDELGAVREGIAAALTHLSEGGRLAVITFHSIEDRIVKSLLRDAAHQGLGVLISKKPLVPQEEELERNPRARSAKLRVFERTHVGSVQETPLSRYAYA